MEALKIELNEQILFSKNEGLFVGIITELRDKAVKVDYAWESVWGAATCVVFTYTTWIPKSQLTGDKFGDLTVKKWFINNMNTEKIYHIKKYFVENNKKCFL